MKEILLKLIANMASSVTTNTLKGKKYLVAPCVMGVEGVLEGSDGAGYYPAEEWQNAVQSWNNKPIVVYHPTVNGKPVSASDPSVMEAHQIGFITNTRWDGKLRTDCWFDEEETRRIDNRIYEALVNNTKMEVSTGVFVHHEPTTGDFNGKSYTWIARNHRPDHLAILPDEKGAASLEDGAGLLVTNSKDTHEALPANQSIESRLSTIQSELYKRFNKEGYYWMGYVVDVFDNYIIYSNDGQLYRLGYTVQDGGDSVTMAESPEEVKRVTEYRLVTNQQTIGITSNISSSYEERQVNKVQRIAALIANGQFTQADEASLNATPDNVIVSLHQKMLDNQKPVAPSVPTTNTTPQVVPVLPAKAPSLDEWLNQAPPAVSVLVRNALNVENTLKNQLIEGIVNNKSNGLSKEWLQLQSLDALQGIYNLAAATQQAATVTANTTVPALTSGFNFMGIQGHVSGVPTNNAQPTTNQTTFLALPSDD